MAEKIPYVPVPSVAPKDIATPSIRENFPEVHMTNAVGEALSHVGAGMGTLGSAYQSVGEAFGKLGNNLQGAGNEIFNRAIALRELQIDKEVDKATIANYQQQGDIAEQFLSKQGEAASPEVMKASLKNAEETRQKIEDGLTSEIAKQKFRAESRGTMGQEARRMSSHAAQQFKNTLIGSTDARISTLTDQAAKSETEDQFQDAMSKAHDIHYDKLAPLKGWSKDQADEEWHNTAGKAIASKIVLMAESDPTRAMQALQENKDNIPAQAYTQVYNTVLTQQYNQQKRNIADRATKDPEESIEVQVDNARKMAEEVRPGDAKLKDLAIGETRNRISVYEQQKREQHQNDWDTIGDALNGRNNPEGKLPTTLEQLSVDPKMRAIYDGFHNDDKTKVERILRENAKGGYRPTEENQKRVRDLWGLATTLKGAEQLRDINLWAEPIPQADKNKLLAEQRRILKGGGPDPEVDKVVHSLKNANSLPADLQKGGDLQNQFRGAIRTAIFDKEDELGRKMNDKERVELGKKILEEIPGTGWFSNYRFFEYDPEVPKDVMDHYKGEGRSEDDIKWMYKKLKAQELERAAEEKKKK